MKYLTLLLSFIATYASAQQSACCIRPVSEQNAELAMNANFQANTWNQPRLNWRKKRAR